MYFPDVGVQVRDITSDVQFKQQRPKSGHKYYMDMIGQIGTITCNKVGCVSVLSTYIALFIFWYEFKEKQCSSSFFPCKKKTNEAMLILPRDEL